MFIYFCDFECGDVLICRFSFWFRLFDNSTGEHKYWMIPTHRCLNTHTLRFSFVYINSKIKSMSLEVVASATIINTEIILLFLFQLRVIRSINDLSVFVATKCNETGSIIAHKHSATPFQIQFQSTTIISNNNKFGFSFPSGQFNDDRECLSEVVYPIEQRAIYVDSNHLYCLLLSIASTSSS